MKNVFEDILLLAKKDCLFKEKLIQTEKSDDPIASFCRLCNVKGISITPGEIFAIGQEMNAEKLRSVNGGGVNAIDGWDDAYENFLCSLKFLK